MLRSLLLLLCWTSSVSLNAKDRFEAVEALLPRTGQAVDLWNSDLTQKLGRARAEIREDELLYTLRADHIPTMHFMKDDQRFSIPGVAATGKAEIFDERGLTRFVYRGSHMAGTVEKQALLQLVRLDHGSCQLSWKLSVINRGEQLRHQEGAVAYACGDEPKVKMHRHEAMHLFPAQDFLKR